MDTALLPALRYDNTAVGLGMVSTGGQRQGRAHFLRVSLPAHAVHPCLGVDLHYMAHRQDLGRK